MKISVVTPWAGSTAFLLPAYREVVRGFDEVVVVDNACDEETSRALAETGWVHVRNERNEGFAGGSNQGYARARGDVVVFLNSDVFMSGDLAAAVRRVRQGEWSEALLGPSIATQMVWGMRVRYLDGFCVAGSRGTWDRLMLMSGTCGPYGPWDAIRYPGPYWEDCDLSFRAMQAGIELVQAGWPVGHIGGQTAGDVSRHGASYERNRATFAASVEPWWRERLAQTEED